MTQLTQKEKEKEAKPVKEYFVEDEEDLGLVEKGAWMKGYTCFRTQSMCECRYYNPNNGFSEPAFRDSVLITIGDIIKMDVVLCPRCAVKRNLHANPFEKFISTALEAERSKQ